MAKKFEIRNSTAEFLIFQIEGKEDGCRLCTGTKVFGVRRRLWRSFLTWVFRISKHLKIFLRQGSL